MGTFFWVPIPVNWYKICSGYPNAHYTYIARPNLNVEVKISNDSFHRYWWTKNPPTQLDKRDAWPNPTKSKKFCHSLMTNYIHKKLRHQLAFSAIWTDKRHKCHTQAKLLVWNAALPRSLFLGYWLIPYRGVDYQWIL